MKYNIFLWVLTILSIVSCQNSIERMPCYTDYSLELVEESLSPLIDKMHPGSKGNERGYEGGTVFLKDNKFQMFVTEEIKGWVGTRFAYWQSEDGISWDRIKTIKESVNEINNPRNALWSPMPFYNENEGRWNLFYVGYEKDGITNGRIFRAYSIVNGPDGLAGPYKDTEGTVLSYEDLNKDLWEGSQGAAAFYIYKVKSKWYGFYASSDSQSHWEEGLAIADSMEGKWVRDSIPNPTFTYCENPVVMKLTDCSYFCVFDDIAQKNTIGYGYSIDGINWEQKFFKIPMPIWATDIRTPQGMIPIEDNLYWIYFTARTHSGFDCVGRIKVNLKKTLIKAKV